MKIRDRIVEFRRVPPTELRPNPKNWRTHPKHQRDALKGLLAEVGIADAVLAYDPGDGGGLMLIDGHLRVEELAGMEEVPVLVLDVNEHEADKLLALSTRLARLPGKTTKSSSSFCKASIPTVLRCRRCSPILSVTWQNRTRFQAGIRRIRF